MPSVFKSLIAAAIDVYVPGTVNTPDSCAFEVVIMDKNKPHVNNKIFLILFFLNYYLFNSVILIFLTKTIILMLNNFKIKKFVNL
jgi:hypothetical protein